MGLVSPQELVQDISKGNFKSLYYFLGSEDYRISEAIRYLSHQFLPDKQIATNLRRLDGRRTKCADLMAELSVYPMLGERQLFAVSDFQSYKPTEVDRILKLLDPGDPNRIVVLFSPSQRSPKKKSAFLRKISAVAECVEFNRLTPSQAARQIKSKLAEADLTIDPAALSLLTGLLDGNRGALVSEVDKLISFNSSGEIISREDIEKVAAGHQVQTVFELAGFVVERNSLKALGLVQRLLAEGSTPTSLLFFLGQHFISLYLIKGGKSLEPNRRWLESRFRAQANQFELSQLERIITQIAATDATLRKKRTRPELALDQLVLQAMSI